MPKLPALTPAKVIKALERAGFRFVRQRGSHRIFVKESFLVVIPFHNHDFKKGTLKHIIKQSGLTLEDFLKLL